MARARKEQWPACRKHPRYRAILKPGGNCEPCWAVWFFEAYSAPIPREVEEGRLIIDPNELSKSA